MGSDGEGGRRLGVFGGTFDPPHLGHLAAAQDVLEALALDEVVFVPAARPPHKDASELAPASVRMQMVEAAVAGDPRYRVSDVEVRRGGVSFTVDTLRLLQDEEPEARLHLLLGVDQWVQFGSWRRPREIARRARLVVMTREGEGTDDPGLGPDGEPPPEFFEVPVTRIDISSTQLRRRIKAGRSVRYLVPDSVRRIIESARLYL